MGNSFRPKRYAAHAAPSSAGRRNRAFDVCARASAFATLLLAATAPAEPPRAEPAPPDRPNVVVILLDDAGYADFGFHGSLQFSTPHMDGIAASGVRCTQAYASASVCSPSRAGLLTGRYQQRFGHEANLPQRPVPPDRPESLGLPLSERTLADHLADAGYRCGAIGKWHLGREPAHHPLERGFHSFFGFLGGSSTYLPEKNPRVVRDLEPIDETRYLTDAFADEAIAFLEEDDARPFFLYLAFNAVHTPMEAPEAELAEHESIRPAARRKLAAMTTSVDRGIGRVVAALERAGVASDTLLFLLNDNGGAIGSNASCNAPLNGMKGSYLEGGVRVPFIVRWPRRLPADATHDTPVSMLDVCATVLAAAGVEPSPDHPLDGVDLLPYLRGEVDGRAHETLFWRREPFAAIRHGDLKLIRLPDRPPLLFDLASDPQEQDDLAASRPDEVRTLMRRLFEWERTLTHPLWRTGYGWRTFNVGHYDRAYELEQPR